MIRLSFLFGLVLVLLVACAPRGAIGFNPEAAAVGTVQTVFYGTTRRPLPSGGGFGSGRSSRLWFGKYDISVPPTHQVGQIEWPRQKVDPSRAFVASDMTRFDSTVAFTDGLAKTLRGLPADEREVVVFVHGYNTNFAEGLFRLVQLTHDYDLANTAVHYSWPSAARTLGYGHDRDSMLFARDGLEQLLGAVQKAGAKRVLLVGHSLGALLVMETLRQAALENRLALHPDLLGVVLISPDIDIDLFRQQVLRIERLPKPFIIFSSQNDRALRLSAMLSGQNQRLGSLSDARILADYDVTLIDVSRFSTRGLGHFTPATSPVLIKILSNLNKIDSAFRNGETLKADPVLGQVVTVGAAQNLR